MDEKKNNPQGSQTVVLPIIDPGAAAAFGLSADGSCCSVNGKAQVSQPSPDQPFVTGTLQTEGGAVPRVSSVLSPADRWGSIKVRWSLGRMRFTVDPGLYALGNPDNDSPVFVTANYKMSFDRLRMSLPDRNAWILVLDTGGINVWCAAGKGTFGTGELVLRIESSGLERLVSHRELILPQLAGPGVAAHQVKKLSGFRVIYGPIRAEDLPAFMDAGRKAFPEMRRKTFNIRERIALIPVELVAALKWALIISPALLLLGGLGGNAGFWAGAVDNGLFAVIALVCAVAAGAVLSPLLLPWLPGRAFSLKGLCMGLITACVLTFFWTDGAAFPAGRMGIIAWLFLIPAISAYLAMNFTGASTYTSLSGVRKEMKWAVPLELGAGGIGLCLWVGSLFMA